MLSSLKLFTGFLLLSSVVLETESSRFSDSTHSLHLSQTHSQTQSGQSSHVASPADSDEPTRTAHVNLFDKVMPQPDFKQLYDLDGPALERLRAKGPMKVANRNTPFIPTKENLENEARLISANYDTNDPRLRELINYFGKFDRMGLERLSRLVKSNTGYPDLNDSATRRLKNPQSFNYQNYFDGSAELSSLSAQEIPKLGVRAYLPGRGRRLRLKSSDDASKGLSHSERIQRLEEGLKRIERKLAQVTGSKQPRALAQKSMQPSMPLFAPPAFYYPFITQQPFLAP